MQHIYGRILLSRGDQVPCLIYEGEERTHLGAARYYSEMLLFDIGANVGIWALQNLEGNTIVAVEASPTTYQRLLKNVAGKNVTALNYAVSDTTADTVKFYESQLDTISTLDRRWLEDPRSRFGINSPYDGYCPSKEISVNAIRLDTLIARYGIPDLLKVDVEGAENIVLRSLSQKVPLLCFEWSAEWSPEAFECIDHLVAIGYTQFHVQNQDAYTYRPSQFEHTASSLKTYLAGTTHMIDWGMIWTSM